jgi:DNA-directed RNA polymerase subunit RPC12/RpoP
MKYICINCFRTIDEDDVLQGSKCIYCEDEILCSWCGEVILDHKSNVCEYDHNIKWDYHPDCLVEANIKDAEIKRNRKLGE